MTNKGSILKELLAAIFAGSFLLLVVMAFRATENCAFNKGRQDLANDIANGRVTIQTITNDTLCGIIVNKEGKQTR